ncbi:cell division protein ZapA [Methylobacillus glycogenes]|uniref:cell division protein ZapA n=1 Tax=Methylobacillus glycogenes TaxID=406 RepID=UPI000471195B|nr:cell division protein ZapA [Methylobacillus glycogenes]MBL8505358.1 cell division protein ZapA [Methylobacillus glycogenes]
MSARGVDVSIMGRELTIACSDEEREGLLRSVDYLDKKMREIRDTGKVVGAEKIAIMAALNIAHELLTANVGGFDIGDFKRRISSMQEQIDAVVVESNQLF